jgi:diaminopimelate epimerase
VTLPQFAVPFVKANACGNDFLLIDTATLSGDSNLSDFTRRICDRHQGVGADGVEWMSAHVSADVEIRLINADGSDAEISGNGTRCVAAYICATREKEKIRIQTGAGLKTCTLISRAESEYDFEVEMGHPEVGKPMEVSTSTGTVSGIPVSLGNPHYVIFVPEFAPDWQIHAAEIQNSAKFPHSVNIEMVVIENKNNVAVRFFERGVGETQSSGTGSCASAVAAIAAGKAMSPVRVQSVGGTQTVRSEHGTVFLRGPAQIVCRGEFFLT